MKRSGQPTCALSRIARVDVLVIDDFAIAPVSEAERRDLLEVIKEEFWTRPPRVLSRIALKGHRRASRARRATERRSA